MGCGFSTAVVSPVTDINNGDARIPQKSNNEKHKPKNANYSLKQDPKPTSRNIESYKVKASNEGTGTASNLNIKPQAEALRLNYEDFKAIDDHAKQTPESVTTDVETLSQYLIKPAKNEIQKVRAFYVWICENISYNTDAYFGGTTSSLDHSAIGTLKSRSSVCEGYAGLFDALCKTVGIQCKKISGYAKGYSHKPGDVISFDKETNHAWNAVNLDGKWRFIESTWGSGYTDKNRKRVKQFSNFYFLCPAEDFICDHFPYMNNNLEESNQWQLLQTPITIETYSQLLKPSAEARQYGVKFTSHPFTTIQVLESTTIKINAPKTKFKGFLFDMFDSVGNLCNEAVIVLLKTNNEALITVRPPKVMKYTLNLYTKFCDGDALPHLTDYIIDCTYVDDYQPYPTHRGHYGPSSDFEERGFVQFTGIDPVIDCKHGEFILPLTTTSHPKVSLNLQGSEGTDHEEYTMIEQSNKSIEIRARLVNKGYR